jgi:hypothetical protein
MKKGNYVIMGFFWKEKELLNKHSCYKFIGKINLRDNGEFEGETDDEFGTALINGRISESALLFHKVYITMPNGEPETLPVDKRDTADYVMLPNNKLTGGGWIGKATVISGKDKHIEKWDTVCLVF